MKLAFLPGLVALFILASPALAQEDAREATLRAADDARVAAMKSPARAQLDAVYSDELHYAHSSGAVDTKASLLELLLTAKSRYTGIDYLDRRFTFPAAGLALMTGRARIQVENDKGGMDAILSFLAVWREENGHWRFLAWQSARLPAAPAAK